MFSWPMFLLDARPYLLLKSRKKQQHNVKYVVSLGDLIRSKRAAGRDVDLEDVRLLELPDEQDTT